jgi:UDP-N-acetylmuramoylalanine--D-glutamate ligase
VKPRPPLPPGPYLIVGLARSGESAALALLAQGQRVIGIDSGPRSDPRLSSIAQRLSAQGVEVHLDASAAEETLREAGVVVKSPGVPQSASPVVAARQMGIPIVGELELAWRLLANDFIAVTGTNGKTTTTEWIGHIHREAGLAVEVAGNVGTAASSLVGKLPAQATIVCEASSFQLEDADLFAPEAAVLLNLAEDHLDRHGSFESYVAAKLRIFANQSAEDVAVLPEDLQIGPGGRARQIRFGSGPEAELAEEVRLPGAHNRFNGMAAAAVCLARGIDQGAIAAGLRSFRGVPHRLEVVSTAGGVTWVNDSKATNVASTIVALESFSGGIHLIAGGRGKGQDFSALAHPVGERCSSVYLIGEATDEIAEALRATDVAVHEVGELEHAVAAARAAAAPGETVLLSPACASYDQYRDFEARGEHFRSLVIEL